MFLFSIVSVDSSNENHSIQNNSMTNVDNLDDDPEKSFMKCYEETMQSLEPKHIASAQFFENGDREKDVESEVFNEEGEEDDEEDTQEEDLENDMHTENMHVILHELISVMSNLNKPLDHDFLDSLVNQLPKIKGIEYPSSTDCADAFDRQSILLKLMIKLYEGISRKSMEENIQTNDLYKDENLLFEIITNVFNESFENCGNKSQRHCINEEHGNCLEDD